MNTINAKKVVFNRFSIVILLIVGSFASVFGQIDPRLGPLAKPNPEDVRNAKIGSVCTSERALPDYKKLVEHMLGGYNYTDQSSLRAAFTIIKSTVGDGSVPEAEAMSYCAYLAPDFERCRILTAKNFPSWDVSDGTITTEDGLKFKMTFIGNHAYTGVLVQKGTTYILTAVLYRAKGFIEGTNLLD
jgi:hypothetical protein